MKINENPYNIYIKNMSPSQLRTLVTDFAEWQNRYILGSWDSKSSISATVGVICHKIVERFYKNGGDINQAMQGYENFIIALDNGKVYYCEDYEIIKQRLGEDIENYQKLEMELKQTFGCREINFGKNGTIEDIFKKVNKGIGFFVEECTSFDMGTEIEIEKSLEFEVKEVINGQEFYSSGPVGFAQEGIPFKGILDKVARTTQVHRISTGDGLIEVPKGSLFIEDLKFKSSFSDMSLDDAGYVFQAMCYYYLAKIEYGEAPRFMIFREIKLSKNKDGSSQQQFIYFPYEGVVFEEYKNFFWRYYYNTLQRMVILQDLDQHYNIFDFINGKENFQKQKEVYAEYNSGQIRSRAMSAVHKKDREVSLEKINLDVINKKSEHEIKQDIAKFENESKPIEKKIQQKLIEFAIQVQFVKKDEGYSYDEYLFKLGRGMSGSKVKAQTNEIAQAIGVEDVRFVTKNETGGFILQVPRAERKYAVVNSVKSYKAKPEIIIGKNIDGQNITVDLSDPNSPHLLIAGSTGSGKTEALKIIVESLRESGDLILIDPKMVGFAEYEDIANKYLVHDEEVAKYLDYNTIKAEIKQRTKILKQKGKKDISEVSQRTMKRKFILIDEMETLTTGLFKEEILAGLREIVKLGRAVGIHLITATQRPDIKAIPGDLKANIPSRICLRLASQTDSKVVLDEIGAEKLLGKGDMLFLNNGKIQRLQGLYKDNN